MSVRLSGPRDEPSLVQTMAAASGSGQLRRSRSPGCTEHTVGLEISYLVGGSAERREGKRRKEKRGRMGVKQKGKKGM